LASFTGNPPSSEMIDPGSRPTSSTKTRPKRSSVKRQRPEKNYELNFKAILAIPI
jgi:hypothetical protein